MDVLVMLEEHPGHSSVLAHVNSVPAPLHGVERPSRDVVTLYGAPNADTLALALAAAVEAHRMDGGNRTEAIRHLGIWSERGAIGDAAWRDEAGALVTQDLEIPLERLHGTAALLLSEFGQVLRRLVAGLSMADWPEGTMRGISVSLGPVPGVAVPVFPPLDAMMDSLREADRFAFEIEGD
jgi:hypothetical protein